jgi:hypothetical protein
LPGGVKASESDFGVEMQSQFLKELLERCEKSLNLAVSEQSAEKNSVVSETFRQKISAISGTACGYLGNHHSFVDLRNAERRA